MRPEGRQPWVCIEREDGTAIEGLLLGYSYSTDPACGDVDVAVRSPIYVTPPGRSRERRDLDRVRALRSRFSTRCSRLSRRSRKPRSHRETAAKIGSQTAPKIRKARSRPEAEIKIGSQTAPKRAFPPMSSSPQNGL